MTKTKTNTSTRIDVKFVAVNETVKNPLIVESDYDMWVKFGDKDKYPDNILKYYKNVGLHRAIVLKKLNMLMGTGVLITDNNREFAASINKRESLQNVLHKCALDLLLFGGYYLQVIWAKGGKQIAEVYHLPFNRIRSGKMNENGTIDKFYYNALPEGFTESTMETEVTEVPAFSHTENKKEPQILFVRDYDPSNFYYPFPDYSGALTDIDTLNEISIFHNANVRNNFQPGFMLFFRGPEPDEDAKNNIVKSLIKKYGGSENAGKPAVFFLDTEQEKPEFVPMDTSGVGEMYQNLMTSVKENIVVSHQIPRSVASIEQAGSLGNTKEVLQNNMIFRKDYIEPKQTKLLTGFNLIASINGIDKIEIKNPTANIMMYDIKDLTGILTQNELRELVGKEALNDIQ